MKRLFSILSIFAFVVFASAQVWLDPSKSLDDRVEDALARMTLQEKIAVIHAQSKFSSPGVARLGIPGLWCTDGPHGVRPEVLWDEWNQAGWTNDSCTAFPALTALSATWNPDLALLYGKCLGEEALYRGKNVLLGPGVNIYRTPLNGRNFEYMGEDPLLASRMVVPYIQGVQQNGVAVCVKHYALNNQEVNRHGYNVHLSDRALYEIYLPAFRAAVTEGKAWSIMGSYNLYKSQHACHNKTLLLDILRDEWHFDGTVISDWGGTHDTDEAVFNGLDLEYGTWTDGMTHNKANAYAAYYLADAYLDGINSGKYTTKELDEKVRNVLRLIFRTSMNPNRGFGSLVSDEHAAAARQIAAESIVLLKNEGNLLPVSHDIRNILVVGENAIRMTTIGGGSSQLKVKYEVSPLEGIKSMVANNSNYQQSVINYSRGYDSKEYAVQDGLKSKQELADSRSAEQLLADAVAAAKTADIVIFIGGLNKAPHQDCEDADREQYNLPYGQDHLIEALADANPRLVVVNMSGNAVAMPWIKRVPAVVQTWYCGSEGGNALADVLFGEVNPSGKLPFTVCQRLEDYPSHQYGAEAYPGVDGQLWYKEDVFVGYRFTDLAGQKQKVINQKLNPQNHKTVKPQHPLFPFGHGLSYTTFTYGNPQSSNSPQGAQIIKSSNSPQGAQIIKSSNSPQGVQISIPVTNTGSRAGKEVVQLYIADLKSSLPRPLKELKAFEKVELQPGETKTVSFTVTEDMLRYFNPDSHEWEAEPGDFEAVIASSAADIKARIKFTLK